MSHPFRVYYIDIINLQYFTFIMRYVNGEEQNSQRHCLDCITHYILCNFLIC